MKRFDYSRMSGGGFLAAGRALSQVLYGNFIAHLLRNPGCVIKRSRTMCAMTGLNIQTHVLYIPPLSRKGKGKSSSCFTFHTVLKKRAAFTLAEVLITLGIIGVVAAMTMPSLIQKYKIQEYVSKLNKFYTVISNAYIRAKQDNGDISGWNLAGYESSSSDEEDFLYYILPYMNVLKFCGKNEKGCFSDIIYGSIGSAGFGLNLNNNSWYSNAILNDGMSISSLTYSNTCGNKGAACALLRVDVNGDTTPNKLGIDLHTFAVYKDRILPGGLSGVLDDEQSINRGDACTAHVIYEKNMDYIKDGKCEIYE